MQNELSDPQSAPLASRRSSRTPKAGRAKASRSMAVFLVNTNIWPLVVAGKCAQLFGFKPVAGFVLGGAMVYGYALFKPLPYVPRSLSVSTGSMSQTPITTPSTPTHVKLHGTVQDADGQPMKEQFKVLVVADRFGPLRSSDGSFVIKVPKSNSYDLALLKEGGRVQLFDGLSPEPDGDGYLLPSVLSFPPNPLDVPVVISQANRRGSAIASGDR